MILYYSLSFIILTEITTILSYDLCSNSRVDSIAYIDDTRQYFITSGGNYWLVKENEMPPKTSGKSMPNGWYGDGSAYINGLSKACKDSSEQLVLVIQGNMYRLFDVRSLTWSDNNAKYNEYKKISHVKMNWGNAMDAIFDFKTFELYAVQGDKYAASNWSTICDGTKQFAENYDQHNAQIDFETRKKIDAIMYVPARGLYVFTGDEYFVMPLDMSRSGHGKIIRHSKSSIKSVRKDFFNCSGSHVPTNPVNPGQPGQPGDPQQPGNENKPQESKDDEDKGGSSGIMWIIIGVVLLIIVVAVIAFLVFMALRKRKSGEPDSGVKSRKSRASGSVKGSRAGSASGSAMASRAGSAVGSKAGSRSKVSPSKFNQMAVTSTASDKKSTRSKLYG